jgi:hypothetical protein
LGRRLDSLYRSQDEINSNHRKVLGNPTHETAGDTLVITSTSIYQEYKPFRNYLRQFALIPSLEELWGYSQHIIEGRPLAAELAVGRPLATATSMSDQIYPWDLDLLAKEVVLNAQNTARRSFRNWNDLITAINHIRRLEENVAVESGQENIFYELYRITHRQFPWQTKMRPDVVIRAYKIFGQSTVDEIVVRELGMSTRQYIQVGLALLGHFMRSPGFSTRQEYAFLDISREATDAYFDRLTCPIGSLRAETARRQSYDRDWPYTWNPLESTPLVRFDPAYPDRVLCPILRHLFRRVTSGIFYDIVKSANFDNPYGNSFQKYVGDVIKSVCQPPQFRILEEHPYIVRTETFHGIDWIVSDQTGHLFIESKTKRLTLNAKTLSDDPALDKDLKVMAQAIVQTYRNIKDALEKKTWWPPDALPIYPMILTLDDWFIFTPHVESMLEAHVKRLFAKEGLSEAMLNQMQYTIASSRDFEMALQIVAQVGINETMSRKTRGEQRAWSLLPALRSEFPEQWRKINWHLFDDEWNGLKPDPPYN